MTTRDVCSVQCVDLSRVNRVRAQMPPTLGLTALFKALSDPTRVKVVYALLYEELCVCEMAALLDTSIQTASHHLRWLKQAELATFRKEGKLVYYRLVPRVAAVVQALTAWEGGLTGGDIVVSGETGTPN